MKLFPVADTATITDLLSLGVAPDEVRKVARKVRRARLRAGTHLTRIGSSRRELMLIVSGRATARRADGTEAEMGAGSVVGEVSLLGIRLFQVADVVVSEDTVVLRIAGEDYLELAPKAPSLAAIVEEAAAKRRASLEKSRTAMRVQRYRDARAIQESLSAKGLPLPLFVD